MYKGKITFFIAFLASLLVSFQEDVNPFRIRTYYNITKGNQSYWYIKKFDTHIILGQECQVRNFQLIAQKRDYLIYQEYIYSNSDTSEITVELIPNKYCLLKKLSKNKIRLYNYSFNDKNLPNSDLKLYKTDPIKRGKEDYKCLYYDYE